MPRTLVSGHSPYESKYGFSRAVRVGNTVYVAGTGPVDPDGMTISPNDPAAQTQACLDIIKSALKQAGADLSHVVRTRLYITDQSFADAVGEVHGRVFANVRPAATMVVAGLLRNDWTVEIEAEAVII